ncbi:MAG: type II toxin-antitoxin system RelB/DinJ family antitoxin [Chloroflexota bacterium]|nr:type II toxin-antitoxin system RelB/DinJ family antitoxin [Chloroflexota bacterium]MDE2969835.1 type II toxin-antitoxin system RelB/DinJ family antitoxin [Chloroflexota bacterium]
MARATARDGTVKVWVEPELRRQAEAALEAIGLTPSDAVALLYRYIAADGDLPQDLHIPNGETLQVINDARKGVGVEAYKTLDDLKAEFR